MVPSYFPSQTLTFKNNNFYSCSAPFALLYFITETHLDTSFFHWGQRYKRIVMYTPLKEENDHESSQSGEDYDALLSESRAARKRSSRFTMYLIIAIPIVSICLVGFGIWIGSRWFASPDDICPRHVQNYCMLTNTLQAVYPWSLG